MKDFTAKPRVVQFKINDDEFRGKPHLAAQTMIDFTLKVDSLGEDLSAQQGFDTMRESLQLVLMPDSFKRFTDRMRDPNAGSVEPADTVLARVRETVLQAISHGSMTIPTSILADLIEQQDSVPVEADPNSPPIELPQVNEILEWIMGEYGMRPPASSEDSSVGSSNPASGTSSTVSVPVGE